MVTNGFVGLDVCGCVDVCILTWVLGLYFDRFMVCTLMVCVSVGVYVKSGCMGIDC